MSRVQYMIETEVRLPEGLRWTRFPVVLNTFEQAKRLIEELVPEFYKEHPKGRDRRFRIIENLTFSVIYEKTIPRP